jgi:hypothetical protein
MYAPGVVNIWLVKNTHIKYPARYNKTRGGETLLIYRTLFHKLLMGNLTKQGIRPYFYVTVYGKKGAPYLIKTTKVWSGFDDEDIVWITDKKFKDNKSAIAFAWELLSAHTFKWAIPARHIIGSIV